MIRQSSGQAMTQGIRIRARRSIGACTVSTLALGASAALISCGEPADGPPVFAPSGLNAAGSSSVINTGTGTNGSQNPGGTNTGSNGTANPSNPTQSQTGSSTPAANGSSVSPANTAPPQGNPNAAPLGNGTGGQSSGGGIASGGGGAGPTASTPTGGTGNTGNTGGTGNTTPPVQQPPAAPDIACPNGATFCSGFESDVLPTGAVYQSQPATTLQFDTTVKHSGTRSLMVVSAGGFNIREVVVPIPGQSFWARLFIQTSNVFGDGDHDSLFVASTATPLQDNNDEHGPEFSEQANQVLLNADDNPIAGANGPGFPQSAGPQLAANTWHCVEAFYDGGSGDVEIFSDGASLIDAPAFKPATFATFRFGYIGFNTVRTVWFDDVVVAPDRVGCN
jgi:hypothetical protein